MQIIRYKEIQRTKSVTTTANRTSDLLLAGQTFNHYTTDDVPRLCAETVVITMLVNDVIGGPLDS